MNATVYLRPETPSKAPARPQTPEPFKVQVTLLDQDNLPLAKGTATLPLLFGMGIFWPSCPMPPSQQLAYAKCFILPSGETLKLESLSLCPGSPPHYNFKVSLP
jgi:hypothetical protein